jgi:hypothetical protein
MSTHSVIIGPMPRPSFDLGRRRVRLAADMGCMRQMRDNILLPVAGQQFHNSP